MSGSPTQGRLRAYLPKAKAGLDVSDMHPDDIERLQRVAETKLHHDRVFAEYVQQHGPTPERSAKAQGNVVVGDDRQGTKVYHFLDTPLARFYKRLGVEDKSDVATDQIRSEFVALMKYRDHWYYSGLEARVGSIDMDRVQASAGALSGGEKQAHHMHVYKKAVEMLGMWPSHIVEHIVCLDRPISQCSAFGIGISPHIFRKMLRDAAQKLVGFWRIT